MAPFAPAEPVAPVAPVAPSLPVTPVAPVAPVAPLTPLAPVAPVAPSLPVTPVAPVAPFVPAVPVAPVTPVAPVAPMPVAPVAPLDGDIQLSVFAPSVLNTYPLLPPDTCRLPTATVNPVVSMGVDCHVDPSYKKVPCGCPNGNDCANDIVTPVDAMVAAYVDPSVDAFAVSNANSFVCVPVIALLGLPFVFAD